MALEDKGAAGLPQEAVAAAQADGVPEGGQVHSFALGCKKLKREMDKRTTVVVQCNTGKRTTG